MLTQPGEMGYFVILSDTHSNLPALERVFQWMQETELPIEGFASLGDQIGYGPFPQETLNLFAEMYDAVNGKAVFLRGNHENAVWGYEDLSRWNPHAVRQISWTKSKVTDDSILLDDSDPVGPSFQINTPRGKVLLVHDNPMAPGEGGYIFDNWDADMCFRSSNDWEVCFYGHTHMPKMFHPSHPGNRLATYFEPGVWVDISEGRWLINPGSVGQPRDDDPRTSFMVYHPLEAKIMNVRLEYDVERTVQAVLDSELDDRLGERLRDGH